MTTQRANPKTGCLTTVVRRLLCSGSQQTHPSDNILDSEETLQLLIPYQEIEEPKKEPTKTETESQNDDVSPPPPPPPAPNVVAKLMGLDNPEPGSNRFRYFDDTGSAVARSKSVNFMDYILRVQDEEEEEDENNKDIQRQSRRVKASVSFREIVPTSSSRSSNSTQQQKKHDFLLLYLDKLDEKRELVNGSSSFSRSKRFDKVLEDSKKPPLPIPVKKKENEKVAKKFKDEPRKVAKKKKKSENRSEKVRWFLSPSKSSKSSEKMALLGDHHQFTGKESESSPENKSNASPVSVLDRDLYDYLILDDDYYFSGGDSESASELSTKQVETTSTKSSSSCCSSPARTRTSTKKDNTTNSNDSEETEFITKLMNMLSDLSEQDINSSTWVSTTSSTKPVDFTQVEDFCVEFGQEILDLVMDQLVDELCI